MHNLKTRTWRRFRKMHQKFEIKHVWSRSERSATKFATEHLSDMCVPAPLSVHVQCLVLLLKLP